MSPVSEGSDNTWGAFPVRHATSVTLCGRCGGGEATAIRPGATRLRRGTNGSVFAFAPFIGAAVALTLGDRSASGLMKVGSLQMLAGVVVHLAESHGHEHEHEGLEHERAHRHDDGHHDHAHAAMPSGSHSHRHRHEPLRHSHAHVPDAHHGHRH